MYHINKNDYYRKMADAALKQNGNHAYVCPLCLNGFSENEINNLTEEDVPQASMAGRRITLTCRKCNSTCGHKIDVYLANAIDNYEKKLFYPQDGRQIRVVKEGQNLNATLTLKIGTTLQCLLIQSETIHIHGNCSMIIFSAKEQLLTYKINSRKLMTVFVCSDIKNAYLYFLL